MKKFVAHAISRLDIIFAAGLDQFFADIFNVRVDEIKIIGHIHTIAQRCSAIAFFETTLPLLAIKIKQQSIFLAGNLYRRLANLYLFCQQVDRKLV